MRVLACALALLAWACGNDGGTPGRDASLRDARFLSDASRQACSADMDTCATLPRQKVCDEARGRCVECSSSEDCAPASELGPLCEESDGTCRCRDDADCQARESGNYCHPIVAACGCIDGDNCTDGFECKLEPYLGTGIRTCRPIQRSRSDQPSR